MAAPRFTRSRSDDELLGIIRLQKANLPARLSPEELRQEGFVTVVHDLDTLRRLNDIEKHIIAKNGNEVIAYLLTMTAASAQEVPVLVPMFNQFSKAMYKDKTVADYRYIVVGQVCVGKDWRGQGLLERCYQYYRKELSPFYEFAITEIDVANTRSLRAHEKVGFRELFRYSSPPATEWSVVIWDWK